MKDAPYTATFVSVLLAYIVMFFPAISCLCRYGWPCSLQAHLCPQSR